MDSWGLDLQMVMSHHIKPIFYVIKKKLKKLKPETLSVAPPQKKQDVRMLINTIESGNAAYRRDGVHPVVMDTVALYPCGPDCSLGSLVQQISHI